MAMFLLLPVPACDESSPSDPKVDLPVPFVWDRIPDLPATWTLNDVWVTGPDDAFAAGLDATVLHWDGTSWAPVPTALPFTVDLWCMWGTSAENLFVAGDGGVIAAWDGAQLSRMTSPTGEDLRGMWGASPRDVFAVGDAGVIVHYDGSRWARMSAPSPDALFDVWGSDSSNVYAVGLDGAIMHCDGAAWTTVSSPTTALLAGIDGTGPGNIFAVGNSGTILHYDGSSWAVMQSPTTTVLHSVAALAGGGAVAVGNNGVLLEYDGSRWVATENVTHHSLFAVGASNSEAIAVGSKVMLRHVGSEWSFINEGAVPLIHGLWGSSVDDVFAVADNGVVLHSVGGQWTRPDTHVRERLAAIWGTGPDNVYAVGADSRIIHFDGARWFQQLDGPADSPDLYGVWGASTDEIWAVGEDGTIWRATSGASWTIANQRRFKNLRGIWGMRADSILAVGEAGEIIVWNGVWWEEMNVRTGPPEERTLANLYAITGFRRESGEWLAWAAGAGGTVVTWRSQDNRWDPLTTGITEDLFALAPGRGGSLFAAGAGGRVYRFDGIRWEDVSPSPGPGLRALWSDPATSEIFAAGGAAPEGGVLFHYGPR